LVLIRIAIPKTDKDRHHGWVTAAKTVTYLTPGGARDR
jgi:hypothetical protein